MIGRALAAQEMVRLLPNALCEGFEQPRLADPGFADQERRLSVALLRAFPGIVKERQFAVASEDGASGRSMRGRKPTLDGALSSRFPYRYRLAKALDVVLADRSKF